jgi:CRP/FNR family transcriptional regulator
MPAARLIQVKSGCGQLRSFRPAMSRRSPCLDCAVRSSALCRTLSPQQLIELNRGAHRRRFPQGQMIAGRDPVEDRFAIVVSGVIKLIKSLPDGRHQIVALLFPSDLLGRPFKPDGRYTAETATAVELCCFSRQAFERLMLEEEALRQLFLERTLDDVDAGRDWMLLLGRKSAQERVAALLLLLLRRLAMPECAACAPQPGGQITLPLSRSEMADYLGLRIETVSRQLQQLRAAGVIETRGRTLTVRDVSALERAAEHDRG